METLTRIPPDNIILLSVVAILLILIVYVLFLDIKDNEARSKKLDLIKALKGDGAKDEEEEEDQQKNREILAQVTTTYIVNEVNRDKNTAYIARKYLRFCFNEFFSIVLQCSTSVNPKRHLNGNIIVNKTGNQLTLDSTNFILVHFYINKQGELVIEPGAISDELFYAYQCKSERIDVQSRNQVLKISDTDGNWIDFKVVRTRFHGIIDEKLEIESSFIKEIDLYGLESLLNLSNNADHVEGKPDQLSLSVLKPLRAPLTRGPKPFHSLGTSVLSPFSPKGTFGETPNEQEYAKKCKHPSSEKLAEEKNMIFEYKAPVPTFVKELLAKGEAPLKNIPEELHPT